MTLIDGAVVLVTGANGGLGREFVRQAIARGASKVYATARTPQEWEDQRIVPVALDVTDQESIDAAVKLTADTSIVINNAGVSGTNSLLTSSIDELKQVFDTNFFGAVAVVKSWAPVLKANGGGAVVDVHSVLSWIGFAGGYSASKAAFWSATNSFRLELAPNGTQVLGLHLGYSDTPMTKNITAEKTDPADVVRDTYDGLEAGQLEVLADPLSAAVKGNLAESIETMYPQLAV